MRCIVWLLAALPPALAGPALPPAPIENFETATEGSGWPRWGEPLGPARRAIRLDVLKGRDGREGRLLYAGANLHVILPAPACKLVGRPRVLSLRLQGDAGGALLSANVIDATQTWFTTEPLALDFKGWRKVRLDLARFRSRSGQAAAAEPEPPFRLLSLNLEFPAAHSGELRFDDLSVEQEPLRGLDFLAVGLGHAGRAGLYLPEDRAPALAVTNRAEASVPADVRWQIGPLTGGGAVLPAPGAAVEVPVRFPASGPQRIEVSLENKEGRRALSLDAVLLPPKLGGPDLFAGLGLRDAAALQDGRLIGDLPLLRSLGVGWTVISLGADFDPRRASYREALTLAWGQGLRVVGSLEGLDESVLAASPDLLEGIPVWWVGGPQADPDAAEVDLGTVHGDWLKALRERLPERSVAVMADLRAAPAAWLAAAKSYFGPLVGAADAVVVGLPARPAAAVAGLPWAMRSFSACAAPGWGGDTWLWAPSWPVDELTGSADRAAAVAVALTCARATPGLRGAGWGDLVAEGGRPGLLGPDGRLTPELLAFAVNARLVGGLPFTGLDTLGPGAFRASFRGELAGVWVCWSEGEATPFDPEPGTRLYDHLGRQLPTGRLTLTGAPLYVVASSSGG